MKFDFYAETDVGLKREINQDSILVDPELNLFVVADGMGGHKGGEVASGIAIETVREVFLQHADSGKMLPQDLVELAYREACQRIHRASTVESPELMGMGTTMVLLWAYRGKVFIGNVGDSRAYLYRGKGLLWQITEDHSLINEQVRAGAISEEEAPNVIGRNVITRSVGFEKIVKVDLFQRDLRMDEKFILCSDGLSSLVSSDKIAKIVEDPSPQRVVERCIKEAKEAGGDDNISVICLVPKSL
ncbi:MAG: Stp1/IreP family PP2C-type Ser/Thr phosphatase [Bdellovibrionales bacterium]|nr:Stp1/IreP family PP2C-type Ser/Thr phosphatase [Bdellovibrionales bacterium]